jgi:hypothetical protein
MLLWVTAVLALLLAAAAWNRAGRLARKLEALNQSYWELRYDFTRLRSQVSRLDPESEQAEPQAEVPRETVAFVSLNSMKKKG